MGSFDVTCAASRLGIGSSDKVVFFPLAKSVGSYEVENMGRAIIDPFAYFHPSFFPIMGKYDSYGRVEPNLLEVKPSLGHIARCDMKSADLTYWLADEFPIGMFLRRDVYNWLMDSFGVSMGYIDHIWDRFIGQVNEYFERYPNREKEIPDFVLREAGMLCPWYDLGPLARFNTLKKLEMVKAEFYDLKRLHDMFISTNTIYGPQYHRGQYVDPRQLAPFKGFVADLAQEDLDNIDY